MEILSFIHPHVFKKLNSFLSSVEHKRRYLKKYFSTFVVLFYLFNLFMHAWVQMSMGSNVVLCLERH